MDGNWWFKTGSTALLALLAALFLVWTFGGWATEAELEAHKGRTAQLEAAAKSAVGEDAKNAANKTLADHKAKAIKEAPGWAQALPIPQQKIALGLDLQGGIDLELQVELRKAVEAASDRYTSTIVERLEEEGITARSSRIAGGADLIVFVAPADREKAREIIHDDIGVFVLVGPRTIEGEEGLVYTFDDAFADRLRTTALQQAVETIRNRIDTFGVTEPVILTKGADRITVQLPGLDDPQRAIDLVGRTAQLEFRMLHDENNWSDNRVKNVVDAAMKEAGLTWEGNWVDAQLKPYLEGKTPEGAEILFEKSFDELTMSHSRERAYLVNKKVELTGDFLDYASVARDQFNVPYVRMELNNEGARIFSDLSGANVGKRMAIVLDDNVNSAPVFQEKIGGGVASITLGDSDSMNALKEAEDLEIVLRAGALPAPIEILHNRTVGRTLGDDSIKAGKTAALLAGILVLIFMTVYYRASGLIANTAIALNILFILALLAAFGATLTLPGIAGIILTIGMAVDANVIVFERIREERYAGRSARAAVQAGYDKATWTVLDANITTFITAAVLYSYGSGPIKGFAVTLMIGIFTSVFTALVVTRLIFDYLTQGRGLADVSIGVPKAAVGSVPSKA